MTTTSAIRLNNILLSQRMQRKIISVGALLSLLPIILVVRLISHSYSLKELPFKISIPAKILGIVGADVENLWVQNITRPESYEIVISPKEAAKENIKIAENERPRLVVKAETEIEEAIKQAEITLQRAESEARVVLSKADAEARSIREHALQKRQHSCSLRTTPSEESLSKVR